MLNKGRWESAYREMSVKFNENVWTLIPEYHDNEERSLFGVIDNNDGSSFSIDVSAKDESHDQFEFEDCAMEYYLRLSKADVNTQEIERFTLKLGDICFGCILYRFNNKTFGDQYIVRGMFWGESSVIGMGIAWPQAVKLPQGIKIPPKFKFFLNNFHLKA